MMTYKIVMLEKLVSQVNQKSNIFYFIHAIRTCALIFKDDS